MFRIIENKFFSLEWESFLWLSSVAYRTVTLELHSLYLLHCTSTSALFKQHRTGWRKIVFYVFNPNLPIWLYGNVARGTARMSFWCSELQSLRTCRGSGGKFTTVLDRGGWRIQSIFVPGTARLFENSCKITVRQTGPFNAAHSYYGIHKMLMTFRNTRVNILAKHWKLFSCWTVVCPQRSVLYFSNICMYLFITIMKSKIILFVSQHFHQIKSAKRQKLACVT